MLIKGVWAAALAVAGFAAAPAAQAGTVSSGWVNNSTITQELCLSLASSVGHDAGFEVTANDVSVAWKKPGGQMVVLRCDAEPYIFFYATHDTWPAAEVEALCDQVEALLVARIDARS